MNHDHSHVNNYVMKSGNDALVRLSAKWTPPLMRLSQIGELTTQMRYTSKTTQMWHDIFSLKMPFIKLQLLQYQDGFKKELAFYLCFNFIGLTYTTKVFLTKSVILWYFFWIKSINLQAYFFFYRRLTDQ